MCKLHIFYTYIAHNIIDTSFFDTYNTIKREQSIPFIVSKYQPNVTTLAAIEEVQTLKEHPSIGKSYDNIEEMMEELLD